MVKVVIVLALLSCSWQGLAFQAEGSEQGSEKQLELSGPSGTMAEGYFRLQVSGLEESDRFFIQSSRDQEFSEVLAEYQPMGVFRELSLSGFVDGTYYFRAVHQADNNEVYSNVVRVDVAHYPRWQAFGLFALGALLFIVLALTIIHFHRQRDAQQRG